MKGNIGSGLDIKLFIVRRFELLKTQLAMCQFNGQIVSRLIILDLNRL